jgi:hypothetical protein
MFAMTVNQLLKLIFCDRPALVKLTSFSQKSQQQATTEEGAEADKEPEEKTFFQKYWYVD